MTALFALFVFLELVCSVCMCVYVAKNEHFSIMYKKMGVSFIIAKSSAYMINVNLCLSIISIIKFYRRYIRVPSAFHHYQTVLFLYLFSIIHSIAHLVNLGILKLWCKCLRLETIVTGFVLVIAFTISALASIKKYYKFFLIIHTVLFYTIITTTLFHSSFCFLRQNDNSCMTSKLSWLFIIPFVFVYVIETLYKYIYPNRIHAVVTKYDNVFKLDLGNRFSSGDTVYICCPSISLLEWHPFSIFDGVCIMSSRGDWTRKMASNPYQTLLVDGPFKYNKRIRYADIMIIATGTGMTRFAAHLVSLCNTKRDEKVVCIRWIVPTLESSLWFYKELQRCSRVIDHIDIKVFVTRESGKNHGFVYYNRPGVCEIFDKRDVRNVYYCGNKELYKELYNAIGKNKIRLSSML